MLSRSAMDEVAACAQQEPAEEGSGRPEHLRRLPTSGLGTSLQRMHTAVAAQELGAAESLRMPATKPARAGTDRSTVECAGCDSWTGSWCLQGETGRGTSGGFCDGVGSVPWCQERQFETRGKRQASTPSAAHHSLTASPSAWVGLLVPGKTRAAANDCREKASKQCSFHVAANPGSDLSCGSKRVQPFSLLANWGFARDCQQSLRRSCSHQRLVVAEMGWSDKCRKA